MPVPPTLAAPEVPDHLGREPWGPGLVTHGLAFSSTCDQARMPGLFCRLWFPFPQGLWETLAWWCKAGQPEEGRARGQV